MAKRQNAIAFTNFTTALDSPSLIGMLMKAQMMAWLQGLASSIVNQLFKQYEPHDTVLMIDMNELKHKVGLPTPQSNPQIMIDQIASLENQFKTTMMSS